MLGMTRAFLAGLIVASACASAQVAAPLDLSLNVPTIQLLIEGRLATVILDTAAGVTVLDTAFAESLPIDSGKPARVLGAGQEVRARRIDRIRVSFPGERPIAVPAVALPLEALSRQMGRRIDGVLGAHFLERHVVEFDYGKRAARFHRAGGFTPPADWSMASVRLDDGRPRIEGLLLGAGSKTYRGEFLVDTGSNHAITLLPKFAERHGLPPQGAWTLEDPALGVAGPAPAVVFLMEGFRLGELHFASPYVRVRQSGRGEERGLIGGALLRHLRFAIDYPGKRLYFGRSAEFGRPFTIDLAGLRVSWEGEDYSHPRILEVFPGRAAARAGLMPGDSIVEPRLTPGQLADRLREPDGTLPLTVSRGGHTMKVDLALEQLSGRKP